MSRMKKIKYSKHAKERLASREFTKEQVTWILDGGAAYYSIHDEHKIKAHKEGISVVFMNTKTILRILTIFKDDEPTKSKKGKVVFKRGGEPPDDSKGDS